MSAKELLAWVFFGLLLLAACLLDKRHKEQLIKQSIECVKNPVAVWKDDRCVRMEGSP